MRTTAVGCCLGSGHVERIVLMLPTVVLTALLIAIDPKRRYIFW